MMASQIGSLAKIWTSKTKSSQRVSRIYHCKYLFGGNIILREPQAKDDDEEVEEEVKTFTLTCWFLGD